MQKTKYDVIFVLPGYSRKPIGGFKIVFLYANHLAERGLRVGICFLCERSFEKYPLPAALRRYFSRVAVSVFPRWFSLSDEVDKLCVFSVSNQDIPESSHIVATAVETAERVASLAPSKGLKHYLIQDYENWCLSNGEVDSTFRLGMSNIVVSKWLQERVFAASGVEPVLVRNPIDSDVFYEEPGIRNAHEVAVLYHESPHKGFANALRAIRKVKERLPDLTVRVFGTARRPNMLPDYCRYTQNATETQLRRIYSESAAYLCGSKAEGFGLTGAESMFCGAVLVSTRFRGVLEYATEECALLSDPGDVDALSANLLSVLTSEPLRMRLSCSGKAHARAMCDMDSAFDTVDMQFDVPQERPEIGRWV